ncbi:SlyX family protein [Marinicella meishanensis]|uniref:SlyX family protein n=1 Tax=Marinicella meishanensis TaxID=2873263 RepID=UPI001CBD54FA|nr:SlyX family protein [Marinicella sp. NBU2979]
MTESKIVDLETRMAFLEDTVDALNKQVYQQAKQLSEFQQAMHNLTRHMKQVQSDIEEFKPDNEIPPHY